MNNPPNSISPEAFMAQPQGAEDETDEALAPFADGMWLLPADPLTSIAESLQQIAGHFARLDGAEAANPSVDAYAGLQREYDELEALHDAKQALVDEVLQVCSKSTSKLANNIRAVLEPVVEPPAAPEPVELVHGLPTGGKSPCGQHYMRGTFGTDPTCPKCLANESAPGPVEPQPAEPAPDADVEVWRAFARGRGYQGADVDTMNHSQIRTMLGIEQPAPGEGDEG